MATWQIEDPLEVASFLCAREIKRYGDLKPMEVEALLRSYMRDADDAPINLSLTDKGKRAVDKTIHIHVSANRAGV